MNALNRWVLCGGLAFLALILAGYFNDGTASAVCSSNGYCYDTGSDPLGGSCGNPSNTGTWWDTCFGLSWQYYEWPEGYTGNISFPGSTNSGYATVSGQCAEYGGFWFLGYEVYTPSTQNSRGYQAGRPRAGMLRDYNATNGYAPLYPRSDMDPFPTPSPNPAITLTLDNGSTIHLTGKEYADVNIMNDVILEDFNRYAINGRLVSGNGNGANGATFDDVNWFCSEKPEEPAPASTVAGMVKVISGNNNNMTGWNSPGEANINLTIAEDEEVEIRFEDYMKGDGSARSVEYSISGDFVTGTENDVFLSFEDDETPEMVSYHENLHVDAAKIRNDFNGSNSGKYCETLTFLDGATPYTMRACATVTIQLPPPEIYGRIGVKASVYDSEDNLLSEIALTETTWNDPSEPPTTIQINLGNDDKATITFYDSMKGENTTPADVIYGITNSALAGYSVNDAFIYDGGSMSGQAYVVNTTELEDVSKTVLICETLRFGEEDARQTIVACANVVKEGEPDLTRSLNSNDSFNFNVEVDLKLAVSLSNRLVTDTGVNGTFLRDSTILGVSSNSANGFVATFTTDKNSTTENATNLTHNYKENIIPTLDSSVLRANFPADRWGYSLDDTGDGDENSTYGPLVAMDSDSPIVAMSSDEPASAQQEIYFGTKMSPLQPTGVFSNSLVFRVVTKVVPATPTTIDDIEYMQDINDEVIASMVLDQQYQLTDKRDGKKYWIAKLSDGNVWMTQNLDFELKKGNVMTNELSDIGYGDKFGGYKTGKTYWLVDHDTISNIKDYYANTDYYDYIDYSWGDGKTVLPSDYIYGYNLYGLGSSYRAASDPAVGTSGEYSYDYYVGPEGTPGHYQDDAECAAVTGFTEEECAHGKSGVLYNNSAAFAGIYYYDVKISSPATDSVCPKGWRIPDLQDASSIYYRYSNLDPEINLRDAPFYFAPTPTLTESRSLSLVRDRYWALSGPGGSYKYALAFGAPTNETYVTYYSSRKSYLVVRCVARYGNEY